MNKYKDKNSNDCYNPIFDDKPRQFKVDNKIRFMIPNDFIIMNNTLHILHLPPITGFKKVDDASVFRYEMLMKELEEQGIKDFEINYGKYNPKNLKMAIHQGHREIVQQAKDRGDERVILAEDDIKFTHPNSFNYFISQIPESYDIFSGLVYVSEMEGNRMINTCAGMTTLYAVHNRFYNFFLSMDINNHVDREMALTAYKHEYYLCEPMIVEQREGYSFNRMRILAYDEFVKDKNMYNG